MSLSSGRLWVVATPLGNPGDLSPRARETLAAVDGVLAEDTRRAGLLLSRCGVSAAAFTSFHEHNEEARLPQALGWLKEGKQLALVSDAGTPLLSDPGYRLVRACREAGIRVSPLPGPSAPAAALSASGLPPYPFVFLGFPPRKQSEREAFFLPYARLSATVVFFERKDRLAATLETLFRLFGPREARLRYARNYNCHLFFTPMLLGIFLRMEEEIAAGRLNAAVQDSLKDTTANTLSAIGDSFFNGTALNTWAVAAACLVLAGLPMAAVALTAILFVLLQFFKIVTFILALRKGLAVLLFLRRLDLINWGDRFKYVNALLLALFLCLALPGASALSWGGVGLYLLLAGWVVGRLHVPRVFVALFLLAAAVTMHLAEIFPDIPHLFFRISGP